MEKKTNYKKMSLSIYVKIHTLELIVLYSMWIYVFLLNILFFG